eukprot:1161937-Pelagomonas_calceolata.AAC.4
MALAGSCPRGENGAQQQDKQELGVRSASEAVSQGVKSERSTLATLRYHQQEGEKRETELH